MRILESRAAYPHIPGDTHRELTRAAMSADGRHWPIGTIYQPGGQGWDNWLSPAAAQVRS